MTTSVCKSLFNIYILSISFNLDNFIPIITNIGEVPRNETFSLHLLPAIYMMHY